MYVSFVSPTCSWSPCSPLLYLLIPSSCNLPVSLLLSLASPIPCLPFLSGSAFHNPRFSLLLASPLLSSPCSLLSCPLPSLQISPFIWNSCERLSELSTLSLKPELHFIQSINYLNFPHSSTASLKKPWDPFPFPCAVRSIGSFSSDDFCLLLQSGGVLQREKAQKTHEHTWMPTFCPVSTVIGFVLRSSLCQ